MFSALGLGLRGFAFIGSIFVDASAFRCRKFAEIDGADRTGNESVTMNIIRKQHRALRFPGAKIPALAAAIVLFGCESEPAAEAETPDQPAPTVQSGDEINLDLWLERLEVGSRELYSAREGVVEAVGLEPGDWVADIGSGTGLYTLLFAEAVGAEGQVFAEDIEPLFLDLVTRRAADADLSNITAVLGRHDDVTLPENSADVIFIADTYHYFDDREAVMRSILKALKPGGELILVEFDITPGEERPDYKSHVRFGKNAVISEIEFVGFKYDGEVKVDGLEENYFVRFVKPAE